MTTARRAELAASTALARASLDAAQGMVNACAMTISLCLHSFRPVDPTILEALAKSSDAMTEAHVEFLRTSIEETRAALAECGADWREAVLR